MSEHPMTAEEIARMVEAACAADDAAVTLTVTEEIARDAGIDTTVPEWWDKI